MKIGEPEKSSKLGPKLADKGAESPVLAAVGPQFGLRLPKQFAARDHPAHTPSSETKHVCIRSAD